MKYLWVRIAVPAMAVLIMVAVAFTGLNHRCYAGEKQADCGNRLAQERIAGFTVVLACAAIVQILVTVGQSYFIQRSVDVAGRQADAAQKALPRAWLYIEFTPSPNKQIIHEGNNSLKIPVYFHNYGLIPGTIVSIDARLYLTGYSRSRLGSTFKFVPLPFALDGHAISDAAEAIEVEAGTVNYKLAGATIATNDKVYEETFMRFRCPPDGEGVRGLRGKGGYLRIIVCYSDPFGDSRETAYLGRFGRGDDNTEIVPVIDPRYSYHR